MAAMDARVPFDAQASPDPRSSCKRSENSGSKRSTIQTVRGGTQLFVLAITLLVIGIGVGVAMALGDDSEPADVTVGTPATLLAAGDIAECDHEGDEATAEILAKYPDATIREPPRNSRSASAPPGAGLRTGCGP
jgi:hypothetical protein